MCATTVGPHLKTNWRAPGGHIKFMSCCTTLLNGCKWPGGVARSAWNINLHTDTYKPARLRIRTQAYQQTYKPTNLQTFKRHIPTAAYLPACRQPARQTGRQAGRQTEMHAYIHQLPDQHRGWSNKQKCGETSKINASKRAPKQN